MKERKNKSRKWETLNGIRGRWTRSELIQWRGCFFPREQIYYTGKGYGVVTPDTYRKTSVVENAEKSLLLSNEEALARAHGTVETYPHGNVVDKAIQTNLVDVICRGRITSRSLFVLLVFEIAVKLGLALTRKIMYLESR